MPIDVSVVIAAHNRAGMIERAVRSAREQSEYQAAEIIVVDDASTDDTAAVAESLGVTVLRHDANQGAAGARNTGIRAARSSWVALLDSDDEFLPHHLATLWPLRGDWSFVSGACIQCSGLDEPVRYHGVLGASPRLLRSPADLYPENFVAASGVLAHRATALDVGGYRAGLRYAEDLDLWIRMLERRPAVVVDDVVTRWWRHPGQKSSDRSGPRAAQLGIIESYAGAPWWSSRLVESNHAVQGWDAFRAHLSAREWLPAAHEATALARPARAIALGRVLRRRRRVRDRSASLDAWGRNRAPEY